MAGMMLAVLLGCWGRSAPADPLGEAVRAWEDGHARLARGDAAGAVEAFDAAHRARPADSLLLAWGARASAASGDLDGALARVDRAIAESPGVAVYRWQRASYRARAGRLDDAAADLRDAIDAGALTPRRALRDPDFAPVADHPAFAFLPAAPFEVHLAAPEGTSFLGSEIPLRLDVVGVEPGPVEIAGSLVGPVSLVRVVEREAPGPDGDPVRTVTWTLRVEGPGEIVAAALTARQGSWTATAPPVRIVTAAPDPVPVPDRLVPTRAPSAVLGARVPPVAWVSDGQAWVAAPSGARIGLRPDAPLAAAWTLGDEVELWPLPAGTTGVSVRVGRDVVLDVDLADP
jgi:hypothetical protein